jgi:hypothetical protein
MNKDELESLYTVLMYLWKDESKHWEEEGKPKDHIFIHLKLLWKYFDRESLKDK